ncbi:hypothetical protein E4O03_00685 [Treponema sp. OMZ 792]|uniref:hypothetical protein n=1 Tax=unclassified Treponema TaxID=2638727 RepID=UPI0020A4D41A|nr:MULTISPECIES: hypothetical protein [unclassified Treponema]UTC73977.1 hypothetical protein E4O03_00685 [Treponema sp. OMZ 792]UTC76488.1 hypothetical protein E4O04_13330 [Treponema sp. OMZ 799]UTC79149.1 hypothetical protein E4O07_00695 [Treponema sp. OMZ 798]
MNNLLRKGFQPVSETEMVMVEGGAGDNGPQKGKDPSCPLPDEGGGRIGRKKKQKKTWDLTRFPEERFGPDTIGGVLPITPWMLYR